MKHILLTLILSCIISASFSQCIVDAGPPTHFCFTGSNPVHIFAQVLQGAPPYQVCWMNSKASKNSLNYAMDDTSILDPTIHYVRTNNSKFYIKLRVIDANQDTCYDSVNVTASSFGRALLEDAFLMVKPGEKLTICGPIRMMGGIQPYKNFTWNDNLLFDITDTTACATMKQGLDKSNTTNYGTHYARQISYRAEDSYGCPFEESMWLGFSITGINEMGISEKLAVFPNPSDGKINIPGNAAFTSYEVFDLQGRRIGIGQSITPGQLSVDVSEEPGTYLVRFSNNSSNTYTVKCIVR